MDETIFRGLAASQRSDVPPFMVMDVMAAAARIEAAGGHVIHMEVGQPAAPAPASARVGSAGILTGTNSEVLALMATLVLRANCRQRCTTLALMP